MSQFNFNGQPISFEVGDSIAAALLRAGISELRTTRFRGEPRSIFCGIGHCYDCLVSIDGVINQRACLAKAQPTLNVASQEGLNE
jgi:aerobic-type carbon monoxide dehydrogenase small subunit (CoxS/CutS family)